MVATCGTDWPFTTFAIGLLPFCIIVFSVSLACVECVFIGAFRRVIPGVVQELIVYPAMSILFLSRPQYIYGPLTNKRDYLDWFFDRVVHGIEFVPLPLHGDQLVALTHAEDVASMLASVIGNENAPNQVDRKG